MTVRRALIVHAHSQRDSFVAAMKDAIADELAGQGFAVDISDLYAKGFNPVASERDFGERENADRLIYPLEQRYGYKTGTIAPDILEEIELLLRADLVVLTFPLYWFSVPAIMKGWFDRVLLSGLCYGGKRIYANGGMAGKRAFAAFSMGARSDMVGPNGIHGELAMGMMRHLFQGTLGYVGMKVHEPFVAHYVPYVGKEAMVDMLDDLRSVTANLQDRPILPVPDLAHFDERFSFKVTS